MKKEGKREGRETSNRAKKGNANLKMMRVKSRDRNRVRKRLLDFGYRNISGKETLLSPSKFHSHVPKIGSNARVIASSGDIFGGELCKSSNLFSSPVVNAPHVPGNACCNSNIIDGRSNGRLNFSSRSPKRRAAGIKLNSIHAHLSSRCARTKLDRSRRSERRQDANPVKSPSWFVRS